MLAADVTSDSGKDPDRSVYEIEEEEEERSWLARFAPLFGLIGVLVVVVYILTSTGDEYEVTAEFQTAANLTTGNEVVLAGATVGSVKGIELGDDGAAVVTFSVNDEFAPLPRGTIATVRSYSLSGLANRQIQLALPPDGEDAEEIPDGGTMAQSETVSEVDLDQLFNTLDDRTVRNLKKVIRGFEISYDGVGEQANEGFRYLNPFLSTSRKLFGELARDERSLEQLVVDTSRLSGALSERAPDLSQLVGNLDAMMSAIASQSEALGISVAELPGFMREANTTFVNLRATLDDLTPLVEASIPAAERLQPFTATLRNFAVDAVPTVEGLDEVVLSPGPNNDLVELTALQVPLEEAAIGSGAPNCGANPETDYGRAANGDFSEGAFGESVCSLRNGLPALAFFRAYSNELVGWFDGFSHPGTLDANGGVGRIEATFNTFTPSPTTGLPFIGVGSLLPESLAANLDLITTDYVNKCPGANERPLGAVAPDDHSVPFLDGSSPYTDPVNCDPSQVAPGP
jgi:phospholipid/cholesterol/gamma-HCH transport system substrate-binding protein